MTIRCPNCNLTHDDSVVICDCGYDLEALRQRQHAASRVAAQKYEFLSAAVIFFWILAVLTGVAGLYSAFLLYADDSSGWAAVTIIVTAVNAFIYIIAAVAINHIIGLYKEIDGIRQSLR